jgi:uncharacterized integral membrane protein
LKVSTIIGLGFIGLGGAMSVFAVMQYNNQGFLSWLLGGEFKDLPLLVGGLGMIIVGAIFIFGLGQSAKAFGHVSSRVIESTGKSAHYAVTG